MPCPIGTDLDLAVNILRSGGVIGLPTETVYGLAGNALDVSAIAKIFEAKGRPTFDPLIVHLADVDWWPRVVSEFPAQAEVLAQKFWPGPLTLVLPKTSTIPDLVTAGLPWVGIRVPSHPLAHEVLKRSNFPLAAPSANLFGRISPTTAQHVAEQLGDRIDYILEGGPCSVGVESTVVRFAPQPQLLRPGGVPLEALEEMIGPLEILPSTDNPGQTAEISPGRLPQHYAPRTPLFLIDREDWGKIDVCGAGAIVLKQPPSGTHHFGKIEILSQHGVLSEASARFFAALRRLDEAKLPIIYAEYLPETGLGRAINDRLRRASTPYSPQPPHSFVH